MTQLLDLPSEIRNHIWHLAFAQRTVTHEVAFNLARELCRACTQHNFEPESYTEYFLPLLTCKQIWEEASPILFNSMTLSISNHNITHGFEEWPVTPLLTRIRHLTIVIHINESNQHHWKRCLTMLFQSCLNLRTLTLHNHMRPPASYENLMDGIFFAAPFVLADMSTRDVEPNLNFDYITEEVMFQSIHLGDIVCSDALPEHSSVVRDLLVDAEFMHAVKLDNLEAMTGCLIHTARRYEQPWFQRLQRRRLEQLARLHQEEQQELQQSQT